MTKQQSLQNHVAEVILSKRKREEGEKRSSEMSKREGIRNRSEVKKKIEKRREWQGSSHFQTMLLE